MLKPQTNGDNTTEYYRVYAIAVFLVYTMLEALLPSICDLGMFWSQTHVTVFTKTVTETLEQCLEWTGRLQGIMN